MLEVRYTREHGSVTASQAILSIVFTLLLTFKSTAGQRLVTYPCVDMEAIRWVRDPNFCDQYYICHFGQPLSMPACPDGQVWGSRALNCVPEGSRWDDCSARTLAPPTLPISPSPTFSINSVRDDWKVSQSLRPKLLRGSRNHFKRPDTRQGVTSRPKRPLPWYLIERRSDNENYVESSKRLDVKRPEVVQNVLTTKLPLYFAGFPKGWKTNSVESSTIAWGERPDERQVQNVIEWYTTSTPPSNTTTAPIQRPRYTQTPGKWGRYQDNKRKKYRQRKTNGKRGPQEKLQRFVNQDHPCFQQPGAFLPHPEMCHWYYNCSLNNLDDTLEAYEDDTLASLDDNKEGFIRLDPYKVRKAGVFVWECRYPQLFDDTTNRCREFLNVKCGARFEPVDQCEYSSRECHSGQCIPCEQRFGRCRGKENGIFPLASTRWSPVFVTCYQERNIAQDECQAPAPIFSPELMDCVSLYEVPKRNGGLLPDCSTRPDGYYPDEQGRCAIFFRCSVGQFRGYDECPPGSVFDPAVPACQPYVLASKPCGEGQAPLCGGKLDGLYADPYGRCTHFFRCQDGLFQNYYSCDSGIFDPLTQRCIIETEKVLRPCGLKPNPCETLPTGVYPDQVTGCKHFIECHHGIMITNGTCDRGHVFSAISGRCDLPENTPPPCGFAPTCSDRPDGRYPALNRGCSFFYECYHSQFISLRRCTAADGGFFFNPGTSKCDYPQNICPPCGYRWWGCSSQDYLT